MKERLLLFIDYLRITTAAFEKKVNLSNGFVANIGDSVREKTLTKISMIYPELNTNWWKTGEGNMLNNNEFLDDNKNPLQYIDLIKINEDLTSFQKELIERLKTSQNQLSESQKQISSLLKILKKD